MCGQGLLICYINHDNLTAKLNTAFSGARGLLILMGTNFLMKMTRLQYSKTSNNILQPGHTYQKF